MSIPDITAGLQMAVFGDYQPPIGCVLSLSASNWLCFVTISLKLAVILTISLQLAVFCDYQPQIGCDL